MRTRLVLAAFAVGLVAVGAALAGIDRNWSTHLDGATEVPSNMSRAQGQTILHLSRDGTALRYKLIAANIENVWQAHIHLGPAGTNGPVVAFLYGPVTPGGGRHDGVLATGTITAANLIGPLAGEPLSVLVDAMNEGTAYVNLHTNDGVEPPNSGPGDLLGGEIRGNLD